LDISLKPGTPLLAVARGTVIAKGAGAQLEGNYLWLKLAPDDTGFPFHLFAKYQHLADVPALNEGDTVEAGQVIALSGNTGTAGGHYGSAGYPHLHLSITAGQSGEFEKRGLFGSMIRGRGAGSADPLLLYAAGVTEPEAVYALPKDRKRVPVPVVGSDGIIRPAGSRVVWPVHCAPVD
jgi:murein DD-endopeptidase MepM/ murein hydrolase activator NlpD